MFYIVFDLEFNQDFASLQNFDKTGIRYPFEIIQIGALKLDLEFNTIDTFNVYVKPYFYAEISPFITELTGITTNQLLSEKGFPDVYADFIKFTGSLDSVFCIWGMSDIKELFKNVHYHKLNDTTLPRKFINIQPYVSKHFNFSTKRLLKLQDAVQLLRLPITTPFHNALNDAYYTAEILKKIYHPFIQPILYDPSYRPVRSQQPKKKIDFEGLIKQFEKMYNRELNEEEQSMIKLAYKMGKTHQFLS